MLALIKIVAGGKKKKLKSSGSRAKMNYLRTNIFLTSKSLSFFWNVQNEWYIDFLQHTLHFPLTGIKVVKASVKWAQNSLLCVNKVHSFNQILCTLAYTCLVKVTVVYVTELKAYITKSLTFQTFWKQILLEIVSICSFKSPLRRQQGHGNEICILELEPTLGYRDNYDTSVSEGQWDPGHRNSFLQVKGMDCRYLHLKVPSQKAPSKEVNCYSHTDEISWSKNELALPQTKLVTTPKQNHICVLLKFWEC